METEQIKTLIRRVFFTEHLSYNIREIGDEEYLVEVSIVEDTLEKEQTNPCAFELTEIY